jgi:hypothetical protein
MRGQQIANIMIIMTHVGGIITTFIFTNFLMLTILGYIGILLAIISLKLNKSPKFI